MFLHSEQARTVIAQIHLSVIGFAPAFISRASSNSASIDGRETSLRRDGKWRCISVSAYVRAIPHRAG